jgi:hypothetical protein
MAESDTIKVREAINTHGLLENNMFLFIVGDGTKKFLPI